MHRGCFVWTPTPPLSGRRTPRPGPARVCVRALLGRVGQAALQGAFWCVSLFLLPFLVRSLLIRPPPGRGCPVCGCCWVLFVFCFFFPSPPLLRPRCVLLCPFSGPGCLGPWRLATPPLFFPSPPLCAPRCLLLFVFSVLGCLGPRPLVAPLPPPPLLSLAFPAFLLPWAFAPPPPLFFGCFFFPSFIFFFVGCAVRGGFVRPGPSGVPACASVVLSLSLLCVCWLVLCGVGCWAWLSCAVSRWVLVSCFGGAVLVSPRGSPPCGSAVISWGIWASQKLSGGTLQDLIELHDPKILGYLLIFGSYFKPIAYC